MEVHVRRRVRTLLFAALVLATTPAAGRTVSIEEALQGTKQNNITWKSLAEGLVQIDALRDTAIALFLPKISADVTWLHLGERHTPDLGMDALFDALRQMGIPIEDSGGGGFDSFVPVKDMITGTFQALVPIIDPTTIPFLQGAYDQHDAVVQRVGRGREQILWGVAKAYYGMLTVQNLIGVSGRSIEAANQHHKSAEVRASLQSATQLEVKRAELEVTRLESQRIEFRASLEKARASFRYLTGLQGELELVDPALNVSAAEKPLQHWLEAASTHRKDLVAAKVELLVAQHELTRVWMKYLPTLNLFGQATLDNNEAQRFDDDPFNWSVGATLALTVWDGGIREAELKSTESKQRQARMAVQDLERKIQSEVEAAYQALADTEAALKLAERQLEVAHATQQLAKASEEAGVATSLEVIDANTMVFASEAQVLGARLGQAMSVLDLLAACGSPLPFGKNPS